MGHRDVPFVPFYLRDTGTYLLSHFIYIYHNQIRKYTFLSHYKYAYLFRTVTTPLCFNMSLDTGMVR